MAVLSLLLSALALAASACTAGPEPGPGPGQEPGPVWVPEPGVSWQYQLQGPVDTGVDADVYVVDLFDVDAAEVAGLQADGRRVVCYLNAGAAEDWRPDAADYPAEVVGEPMRRWRGENWLDVRRLDVLEPLLAARMDLCASKGFDAVDPDNLDGYLQRTGFPITPSDQLGFNGMLARLAHERGLGIGLKNDVDQVPELVDRFDFAVNESCWTEGECADLQPFVDAGKAVLHVEYDATADEFCPDTTGLGFSSIRKARDLGPAREVCPAR